MPNTTSNSPSFIGEATAAILTQITSDLSHCLDCQWIVATSKVDGNPLPICAEGAHPDLRAFLVYLRSGLGAHCSARLHLQPWMPHLIYPIGIPDGGDVLLAFGPKKNDEPYSATDRDLVSSVIGQVETLLRNGTLARCMASNIESARRRKEELKRAREVQCRLLPAERPPIRGIEYYGHCEQAGVVGRDLFDFVPLRQSALAISIGDVCGEGVPAAIIMSALQSTMRTLAASPCVNALEILKRINPLMWEMAPDHFYATLFYAILDARNRRLSFVNAAHEPALLLRSRTGRIQRLESTGIALGLTRDATYREMNVHLDAGDLLVAFTSGVSELLRERDFMRKIQEHRDETPMELTHRILDFANSFAGDAGDEDRTVVVARFSGYSEIMLARTREAVVWHSPRVSIPA